jgi:hypothetical protein
VNCLVLAILTPPAIVAKDYTPVRGLWIPRNWLGSRFFTISGMIGTTLASGVREAVLALEERIRPAYRHHKNNLFRAGVLFPVCSIASDCAAARRQM